jgi:glycosyltransferase involved in cell wall biosynthesis
MHIVELTDFYRPVIGGLERHVETLSRGLSGLGHTVTVVTLQTGDDPAEEMLDGVRVVRIRGWSSALTALHADAGRPFHPTFPDPGAMAAVHRVVQSERPDVVHSHSWLQYSWFPWHRAQRGPAHVVTLHDYGLACAKKTLQYSPRRAADPAVRARPCSGPGLAKCLACAPSQYGAVKGTVVAAGLRASWNLHGRADRYIAISNAVADGCRPALPAKTEVTVIPSPVPDDLPELARRTPRPDFLPPEDGYIMFAGALGRHKGVDVLLEAWHQLRERPPLVLLGTPQADTPPLDGAGIFVQHNVPSAQVMAAWAHASVAAVPSVCNEALGQVAVEAMLTGLPVVASDEGGLRDVVENGVTGRLVPPGQPGALAGALAGLLADPKARQAMGTAGRLRARRFEAASVVPRVAEILTEAVANRVSASRVSASRVRASRVRAGGR